jgi:tetratricopeptide (TPR) repeat protein
MAHRERAIEIYRLQTPLPKEKLAESLSALAVTVSYRGDTATAIPYQEEALALRRELAEADSLIVAETQEVLAQILSSARKYVMALPLFEETLTIKELKLGPDHHGTLSTRNNMAVTLIGLGRHEAAEQQLRTVLEIRLQKDGTWHQETAAAMQNLAATLAHQGKSNEASEHLGRAHEIYQRILTPDHYLIAYPLLTRAFLQLQLNDAVGAEQSAVEATRILRLALPQGHFATTMGECRWGQALARQGRHAEAEPLLAQSVIDAENPQMPVEYRAECREALAGLYEETGRAETARDLRSN